MDTIDLEPLKRLTKDLKKAAAVLSKQEARYLVDLYYQLQAQRIVAGNQLRALYKSGEPHEVISWVENQSSALEEQIKRALDAYSSGQPLGKWAKSIVGIGPVISAGLLAHIDVTKVKSAAGIWRYAGLDPTVKWEKGKKRPWNASLKLVCFKIGESFIKQQNRENDFYGHLYAKRRARENEMNANGALKHEAERALSEKKYRKETVAFEAYSNGQLPDAHMLRRSARWTVKLFLSHYYDVAYQYEYGKPPARPFAFDILGHDKDHLIAVPNNPFRSLKSDLE